jgi:predicted Zn finger-like uncharacterized protein
MIISCEKCGTKFRLDDDAVKAGGTRVRCSLCRHVFTVYPTRPTGVPVPGGRAGDGRAHGGDEEKVASSVRRLPGGVDDFEDFLSEFDDDFLEDELGGSRRRKSPADGRKDSQDFFPVSKAEKKKPSMLWRIFRFFFIIILAIALMAAALFYWDPVMFREYVEEYIPVKLFESAEEIPDDGVSRLVLSGVSGNFVESRITGSLFVVRGEVKNEFPGDRSFIELEGSILDEKEMVVLSRTVYAGNPIPDEELELMSHEEIAAAMNNRDGMDGMNVNVPSGSSIPFAIVFEDLPENVVEFKVEAVSSIPGTL